MLYQQCFYKEIYATILHALISFFHIKYEYYKQIHKTTNIKHYLQLLGFTLH